MKQILLFVDMLLVLGGFAQAQTTSSDSKPVQTVTQVAKALADQHKVLEFPQKETGTKFRKVQYLNREVEVDIKNEDATFPFREGESRAVLLKLPDYTSPYLINIWSRGFGFMTLKGFYPVGVALDVGFAPLTHKIEAAWQADKRFMFEVLITVDESWRIARYILFYTDAREVGKFAGSWGGGTTTVDTGNYKVTGVPVLPVKFERGAIGRLKFRKLTEVKKK